MHYDYDDIIPNKLD